ncbi:hypothetical protein C8J57DRAFT_1221180 [Mycena rebaudengoi]|nr:hypothetical protein C8J57DRAFT_1221180 [Mycena rebaudengoi]
MYAKEAYRSSEHMGDIYGQAWSLHSQAKCHMTLANYQHAQHLLQKGEDMLTACGQHQSSLRLNILNHQAEIHLLKSEYRESRQIHLAIASSCNPTSFQAVIANLNIALIDITTGAYSKIIFQKLDMGQSHLKALYGYPGRLACFTADFAAAELHLRDGAIGPVKAMFEKCLTSSQEPQLVLLCLERLGDHSTGMNDVQTTLRWTGIFLGLALRCKEKHKTLQAFRFLGQIFSAQGDDETALSLFKVALDGFTFMDVHHSRADCMVRIADILNSRGEVMKAVELWKTARPLFEWSSQMKDIIKIDAKLAEVDSAILVEYEEQLQQLSELHVPIRAPEDTYITEEEEEDELAQGTDVGDKGRQF